MVAPGTRAVRKESTWIRRPLLACHWPNPGDAAAFTFPRGDGHVSIPEVGQSLHAAASFQFVVGKRRAARLMADDRIRESLRKLACNTPCFSSPLQKHSPKKKPVGGQPSQAPSAGPGPRSSRNNPPPYLPVGIRHRR
jgi:hypothetical protein